MIQGFNRTPLQPGLLVCFQGEFESVFKQWLHSVVKGGGNVARHDGLSLSSAASRSCHSCWPLA